MHKKHRHISIFWKRYIGLHCVALLKLRFRHRVIEARHKNLERGKQRTGHERINWQFRHATFWDSRRVGRDRLPIASRELSLWSPKLVEVDKITKLLSKEFFSLGALEDDRIFAGPPKKKSSPVGQENFPTASVFNPVLANCLIKGLF